MTARDYYRGQPVYYNEDSKKWRFDEKADEFYRCSEIDDFNKVQCTRCKQYMLKNEPDQCLGYLNGVVSTCCGHGIKRGYIVFKNGKKITFENARIEV